MTIPQQDLPWMAIPDQLGIPLEWSAHVYVRHDHEVREQLRRMMSRITSQTKHYQVEHDQDPPTALREQHDLALQVEAELSDTQDLSAARARGWWRLAVSGTTEAECLENVERVVTAYARRVQIEHTYGQHDLAREFLPGEPVRIRAHRRDLPVRTVAAGGAAITSHGRGSAGVDHRPGGAGWADPGDVRPVGQHGTVRRRRLLPDRRRPRRRQVHPDRRHHRQDRRRRHPLDLRRPRRPARPAGPHRTAPGACAGVGPGQRAPRVAEHVPAGRRTAPGRLHHPRPGRPGRHRPARPRASTAADLGTVTLAGPGPRARRRAAEPLAAAGRGCGRRPPAGGSRSTP